MNSFHLETSESNDENLSSGSNAGSYSQSDSKKSSTLEIKDDSSYKSSDLYENKSNRFGNSNKDSLIKQKNLKTTKIKNHNKTRIVSISLSKIDFITDEK